MSFTNIGGGDHSGADWTISTNINIAGVHTNIGTFKVNTGITATVEPYSGSAYGTLSISAEDIDIVGVLNASVKGYGGGAGGAGGVGGSGYNDSDQAGSAGGAGSRGGANGSASVGSGSSYSTVQYRGSNGGNGGAGGGTYGGSASTGGVGQYEAGSVGASGLKGGYAGTGINGDSSTDDSVNIGSGGAGGGGGGAGGGEGHIEWVGGGGGGAAGGGYGGGSISLIASISLTVTGSILCTGGSGGSYGGLSGTGRTGTVGGNTASNGNIYKESTSAPDAGEGAHGGAGGAGAGGGCLIKCTRTNGIALVGSTIDLRGGGSSTTNGGTLKIKYIGEYTTGTSYVGKTTPIDILPTATGYIGVGNVTNKLRLVASVDADYSELKIDKSGTTYSADLVTDTTLFPVKVKTQNGTLAWRDESAE